MIMSKDKNHEDDLFQRDGKYCITVYFGAERLHKFVVTADTYGEAIQKIVSDYLKDYPEGFEYDSEIKFVREIFDEIK